MDKPPTDREAPHPLPLHPSTQVSNHTHCGNISPLLRGCVELLLTKQSRPQTSPAQLNKDPWMGATDRNTRLAGGITSFKESAAFSTHETHWKQRKASANHTVRTAQNVSSLPKEAHAVGARLLPQQRRCRRPSISATTVTWQTNRDDASYPGVSKERSKANRPACTA